MIHISANRLMGKEEHLFSSIHLYFISNFYKTFRKYFYFSLTFYTDYILKKLYVFYMQVNYYEWDAQNVLMRNNKVSPKNTRLFEFALIYTAVHLK